MTNSLKFRLACGRIGCGCLAAFCLALAIAGTWTTAPAFASWAIGSGRSSVPPPTYTAPPVISGTTQDGQVLTTTTGSWSSPLSLTYKYQWQRCDSTGAGCATITHATTSTDKLTSQDVGHQLTVTVTATDTAHQTGMASAAAVGPVTSPAAPLDTALPAISGTLQDGQTLKATSGAWSSPDALAYRYQWQLCGSAGTGCANIPGATASSYKALSASVNHQLTVVVTATDKENQAVPATATPVGPVTPPPPPFTTVPPAISGTPQDGQTLQATGGTWSSPDSLAYHYQWQRCDSSGAGCTNVSGAASTLYKLTGADFGHQVTVLVTATDRENQTGPSSALPVGPVTAPPPPANSAPPMISGPTQASMTLSVSDGSWTSTDPLAFSYQWQRCDSTGANCAPIQGQNAPSYTLTSDDVGSDINVVVTATDSENQVTGATAGAVGPIAAGPTLTGIHKIQHVVIIMQENRSFDNYFGTYPGADGIPAGVCAPDPRNGGCVAPYHDTANSDLGGPHGWVPSAADIDNGRMDGFVGQAEKDCGTAIRVCAPCSQSQPTQCIDVMGYHDSREIPNYWTYANNFVLQDHMFESAPAVSGPSHLYQVSGWSASCTDPQDPFSCTTNLTSPSPPTGKPLYAWTDVTYLLHAAGVSWGYYVFQGSEPDCESNSQLTCAPVQQGPKTPSIWNPLPSFTTVNKDGQLGNVQTLSSFFTAAKDGALPAVSWIVPNGVVSEHPPSTLSAGQTYVTGLVNAIMRSPDWGSTAIFVSWDDWGGFYDNVVPPAVDQNGYGLRVPGLVISPYAKHGYIDSQTLSHDAYLKFIEDDFLGGQRLDPATDGRPDPRPTVRENAPQLGDLSSDFNFSQASRPPVILPVCPTTDLTPTPNC